MTPNIIKKKPGEMKLKFSIHYSTAWGENIHVVITYKNCLGRKKSYNLPMKTEDGDLWFTETAVMESRQRPVESFTYYYQVENETGEVLRQEWNKIKREYAFDSSKDYILPDIWRDTPLQYHLYTQAYNTVSGKEKGGKTCMARVPLYRKTIIFRVSAPQLQSGESLAICGNHPSLGDWSPLRYLRMSYIGDCEWLLSVNVENIHHDIEYKYVVIDDRTSLLKAWEEGENRTTGGHALRDGQVLVLYNEPLRLKEAAWKIAGVSVPLFSLRTEDSFGVGDFGDLRKLIDWTVVTGMKMIQLLPVNDTSSTHGWTDSHPYNCISAFAIHPHYIDLNQLPPLADKQAMTVFHRQRRELNAMDYSDYMAVDRVKQDYIDKVYEENGEDTLSSPEYKEFMEANRFWLLPYAVFCALRDKFGTSRFQDWKNYSTYNEPSIERLSMEGSSLYKAIRKTCYLQYHLHRQFKTVAEYARGKGVALKGDIPVGVYRDSVETWQHPEFFNMEAQMGTPPSASERMGQNWGFPTYVWNDACEAWFRQRLAHMEQFYDAIRIDHIVSFFRHWEIPVGSLFGTMGHFAPSLPLSEEEIGHYGLTFHRELFTRPFINDNILERIFGIHTQYVRDNFLQRKAYNMYDLKAEYSTQVRIRSCFHDKNDENSLWIRDGLYKLCANVLFLEDPEQKGMYHPRIGVFNEPVYNILSREDKEAFMRLYNDYFYERHNKYWAFIAQRKLSSLLKDTRMLVCAEDLGMLPGGISGVLDSQRILSLEIQTMSKNRDFEFAHLEANPYRSVATISTHDMAPMRLWWEEERGSVQRYYATMLQKEGKAPRTLPAHIAEEIIARHLYCPSMLCIISIQDWLAMDDNLRSKDAGNERINTPYDPYNQWKYRMNVKIEQLLDNSMFNKKLRTMITRSKRI